MPPLPKVVPPTVQTATWLTDEDHGRIRRSVQKTPEGYVKLFDPGKDHLSYGQASTLENQSGNIQFGEVEPGFAVVRGDHPALNLDDEWCLFRRERRIILVEDAREDEQDDGDDAPVTSSRNPKPRPARGVRTA